MAPPLEALLAGGPDIKPRGGSFTALAVASGKGGVGKTMLSVALAFELSQNAPTLIIDLDFFNRGLTGLLRRGRLVKRLKAPGLLPEFSLAPAPAAAVDWADEADPGEAPAAVSEWELIEVSAKLFTIRYPDLSTDDYARIENTPIDQLARSLAEYVAYAAQECGAHFVVLDCHGGPDRTSFAACKIARTSLLISEPDRITLYGTLNFLRQLQDAGGGRDEDIRLVFNKVVASFTAPFLLRFYNDNIRREFAGRPLLAMFPLEEYLTKAFEKNALLAKVFPESLLARKTRVYLYDLLAQDEPQHLSRYLKRMSRFERRLTRYTLGREFLLLTSDFTIATIFSVAMVLVAAQVLFDFGGDILGDQGRSVVSDFIDFFLSEAHFAVFALLWFLLSLFRGWMSRLTRATIFLARTGSPVRAFLAALTKAVVVTPAVALIGVFWRELMVFLDAYADLLFYEGPSFVIAITFFAIFLGEYCFDHVRRALPLRRYAQISRVERQTNQVALIVPLLLGVPFWFL